MCALTGYLASHALAANWISGIESNVESNKMIAYCLERRDTRLEIDAPNTFLILISRSRELTSNSVTPKIPRLAIRMATPVNSVKTRSACCSDLNC